MVMTEDQFRKILGQALAEQDERFDKKVEKRLEQNNAVLFGQIAKHVDERIGEVKAEMTDRFDQLATTMDGIAKRLETDDQERAAISNQVDRHEGWIGQIAKHAGTK